MKTHEFGKDARYSLQNGATVPAPTADALIRNGWVKRCSDGLPFPDENTQTYEVLKP